MILKTLGSRLFLTTKVSIFLIGKGAESYHSSAPSLKVICISYFWKSQGQLKTLDYLLLRMND